MKVAKRPRLLVAIVTGSVVSLLIMFVCLCVASTMILNNSVGANQEGVLIVGVHVLSTLIGAAVSCALCEKPLISCGCVVCVMLLLELSATIFAYSGEFQNAFICVFADFLGGLSGMLLMVLTKNKKGRGIKKYRPR